jgi:putative resolvase
VIVVEHRDRLARFGMEQAHAAQAAQGRRIVVIGDSESSDGLVGEIIEVFTSMCVGLCGRAMRAMAATEDPEPARAG